MILHGMFSGQNTVIYVLQLQRVALATNSFTHILYTSEIYQDSFSLLTLPLVTLHTHTHTKKKQEKKHNTNLLTVKYC